MIFYEITKQDLKVGSHVKNTKTGVEYLVTWVEYARQEDNIEFVIDDKFIISRYGISHWNMTLILMRNNCKTIKYYMCGKVFHVKLVTNK